MMLGARKGWIPIYMTGQISPYYLTNDSGNILCHLDYVSGAAALSGECISGAHGRGKYHLTKNKDEVAYYRAKSQLLLKKAQPLMKIFRQNSEKAYRSFISSDAQKAPVMGYCLPHCILSAVTCLRVYLRDAILRQQIQKRF